MGRVSAQAVGDCCVASQAVLRVVHRYATSLVRCTVGKGNQIGEARRELLPDGFDPGDEGA